MPRKNTDELAQHWKDLLSLTPVIVCEQVQQLALDNQDLLAGFFYRHMLENASARIFLSHEQVQERLHGSLKKWLVELFSAYKQSSLVDLVLLQVRVGEIHARIDVPVHLVLRGARFLKQAFGELLHTSMVEPRQQALASYYVDRFIDMGMEVMSYAYGQSKDRQSRAEESYRLFAVVQNAAAERGKQHAALLDWENALIFGVATHEAATCLPRVGTSDFGLWFRHKGAYAFQGTPEAAHILETMRVIDQELIPELELTLQQSDSYVQLLRNLRDHSRGINIHLNNLFDQHNELESGRDVLTRLLSRKYLAVVLNKEIAYARRRDAEFALVGIDLDYFKDINDSYGHEAGDVVLQQLAELLSAGTRSGDYVFRLGGEEFLIVLVDINHEGALRLVKKLKQQLVSESFNLPGGLKLNLTASFGVVMFDGHPDYQQCLRRVDAALYKAKSSGRNSIVFDE